MGVHEEQILSQLNPQSGQSLINLAQNVRGLLVLGLSRFDGASTWDANAQRERQSVLGALEHGAEVIRKRFAKDLAPVSKAAPRASLTAEEAARARSRNLDLDLVERAAPPPFAPTHAARALSAPADTGHSTVHLLSPNYLTGLCGQAQTPVGVAPGHHVTTKRESVTCPDCRGIFAPKADWSKNLTPTVTVVKRVPSCPPGKHLIPGNGWDDRCTACGWKRDTCMRRGRQVQRGSLEARR